MLKRKGMKLAIITIKLAKVSNPPKYKNDRRGENKAAPVNDANANIVPTTAIRTSSGSMNKTVLSNGPRSSPCKNPKANNIPSLPLSLILPRDTWIQKKRAKDARMPRPPISLAIL